MTTNQLHDFISKLCNEEKYEPVEGRWIFESGGDCCRCTDGAIKVALAFGGRVAGYNAAKNPTALIGQKFCGGHDFAIVANRFIVDYWAFRVARLTSTPVLDMNKPSERELVRLLYGNEQTWKDMPVASGD